MPEETPKPKKKTSTLAEETMRLLREKLLSVEQELEISKKHVAQAENRASRAERIVTAAQDDADALMNAVRVLAAEVSPTSAYGKRARAAARKAIEGRKMSPPGSLGSSRQRR